MQNGAKLLLSLGQALICMGLPEQSHAQHHAESHYISKTRIRYDRLSSIFKKLFSAAEIFPDQIHNQLNAKWKLFFGI